MNPEYYKEKIKKYGLDNYYVCGIDLGTTNSVISYYTKDGPLAVDVSMGFGKIPLPSVVQYRSNSNEWIIGEEARQGAALFPHTTFRSIKSFMGTTETFKAGGRTYKPQELSAKILAKLVEQIKNLNPNGELAALVVSVPYDFDDGAKKATIEAIDLAGCKDQLICLIEEPKAAALAYSFNQALEQGEKIMIFDFGGGTLDITVFEVLKKEKRNLYLKVIAQGGAVNHGGDNVDQIILSHCYKVFKEKTGQSEMSAEHKMELSLRVREAKERLSGIKTHRIPFAFAMPPFMEELTRAAFEEMLNPFIEKTKKLVQKTLREANLETWDIHRVLLEGGASGMPWVKENFKLMFGKDVVYSSPTPALDVSMGAAYYGALKMGLLSAPGMEIPIEIDATLPHDIGIELNGDNPSFFPIIRKGISYPLAKKSYVFTLSGQDMTTVNLKIMERRNKEDKLSQCVNIGNLTIGGLPERPGGKTRLKLTLTAEEDSGTIKGSIEDLGFDEEFAPSGFKRDFDLNRYKNTILEV